MVYRCSNSVTRVTVFWVILNICLLSLIYFHCTKYHKMSSLLPLGALQTTWILMILSRKTIFSHFSYAHAQLRAVITSCTESCSFTTESMSPLEEWDTKQGEEQAQNVGRTDKDQLGIFFNSQYRWIPETKDITFPVYSGRLQSHRLYNLFYLTNVFVWTVVSNEWMNPFTELYLDNKLEQRWRDLPLTVDTLPTILCRRKGLRNAEGAITKWLKRQIEMNLTHFELYHHVHAEQKTFPVSAETSS